MNSPVDITQVVTWPQALVAVVVVIAVLVVPQIVGLIQNGAIKRQFANNGGSTLKDAVDRIEQTLTEHVAASEARALVVDDRLSEIEASNGRHAGA